MADIIETLIARKIGEEIASDIKITFEKIDEIEIGVEEKFIEFRPVITGYMLAYDSVLKALGLEPNLPETDIPLITIINDMFDEWHEERISEKEIWNAIRNVISK